MFTKIIKIKNIGLFNDAVAKEHVVIGKVALFYADNGRGKSTLARIFRSYSLNDPVLIHEKKTIDTALLPQVELLKSDNNRKLSTVLFDNHAWSDSEPIEIFDSEFVDQNVYSGFEVKPEQRASLLEFVLGDQTVKLKHKIDTITKEVEDQTKIRNAAEKLIKAYAGPYIVSEFIAIPKIEGLNSKIEKAQKAMEATKKVVELSKRQSPDEIPQLDLDIIQLFGLLGKQLEDVEAESEIIIKKHLEEHSSLGLENWISSNPDMLKNENCPYCGQSTNGLEIIRHYKAYFNKSYEKLKSEVLSKEDFLTNFFSESKIERLKSIQSTNQARIEAWQDQIAIEVPALSYDIIKKAFEELKQSLLKLIRAKRMSPLEPMGSEAEAETALTSLTKINDLIKEYNKQTKVIAAKISDFKKDLSSKNTETLQEYIKKLGIAENRQLPEATVAVADYQRADTERKRLEGEKIKTKQQVQDLMKDTLEKYQKSINELLVKFGAEFSIEELKPSYLGDGTARTEYGLKIRGKNVKLGTRMSSQGGHSFSTTLSEADKRTLAFAFFIAKLQNEKSLKSKTIVLDDPVSSLDQNRRTQTIELVLHLIAECEQVIVLSHDCYFLRSIEEVLAKQKQSPALSVYDIKRGDKGYSVIQKCNLGSLCSSDYYHHYNLLEKYSNSTVGVNSREVAKAIRPLLEGYYHRKFPNHIPRRKMFGEIIQIIKQSDPSGPLSSQISMCAELTTVNDYAGKFHHDTNPSYETTPVTDSELTSYVERTLKILRS